jgi:hypothetical protein
LAAAGAGLTALLLYLYTLAPSVTWLHNGADSGDLAAAAFTLGIPHPPGYPLFTLVASLFAHLPLFEPARGVGVFVVIAGALAVFVLARAAHALIAPLGLSVSTMLIPPLAALGFAFSPALWSQATIAEVYTLNLLFVAIILWAMVSDDHHRVAIAATAFGFGMAHHLSILLIAPGAWLALKPTRRDLRLLLFIFAPLVLYLYLPLRAAFYPPVNWGNPSTLEGFLWVVTAAPYHSFLFDLPLTDIAGRVAFAARLMFEQFTAPGVALALWGLFRMAQLRPRLAAALGLSGALVVGYSLVYGTRDSFIYLLPAFAIMVLWLVYGVSDLMRLLEPLPQRRRRRPEPQSRPRGGGTVLWPTMRKAGRVLIVAGLVALVVYNLWENFGAMDLSADRVAYEYARGIIDKVPRDAVIFADGDEALLSLVYYRQAIAFNHSGAVIVSQGLLQYDWYYKELVEMMNEVRFAPPDVKPEYHQRAIEIVNVTFAEGREVCFDKSSPLLPGFEYETRYGLSCVVAESQ